MIPSNTQVMRAARRLLTEVQQSQQSTVNADKLRMIDAMLNDLSLEIEATAYEGHVERGTELLRESAQLALRLGDMECHRSVLQIADRLSVKGSDYGKARQQVLTVSRELIRCVELFYARRSTASEMQLIDALYQRIAKWEQALYASRLNSAQSPPTSIPKRELRADVVQVYLRSKNTGLPPLTVLKCTQLTGGFNRSTWLIEAEDERKERLDFVIRAEQPVSATPISGFDITTEFGVLQIAYRAGIAVPEPLWMEPDTSRLGMRFLASRRASGVNFGTFAGPDRPLTPNVLSSLMDGLVAIHRVDVTRDPVLLQSTHLKEWSRCSTITEAITFWVKNWHSVWKSGPAYSPIVARAVTWLLDNVPQCSDRPVLLHSDYALGNILIEHDRVSAVLDWEATHIGDPAEEVSWLMSNLRSVVDREKLYRLYREAGGCEIDDYRLRYFDVFAAAKLLMCGIYAFRQFEQYEDANPNLHWLSLQLMPPPSRSIDELIAIAEAAKPSRR